MCIENYINKYIKENHTPKLQLGCGNYPLVGWFNTDIDKSLLDKNKDIFYMDASKTFPIPDSVFTYIFAEHLIEHLSYEEENVMLQECYRVLKPNGVLRISTPNLEFLLNLYQHPENTINRRYIKYDSRRSKLPQNSVYVINRFHTEWGHKIIHDPGSLQDLLIKNKFSSVYRSSVGNSNFDCLKNIDNHTKHFKNIKNPEDFNILQSMVFEAIK